MKHTNALMLNTVFNQKDLTVVHIKNKTKQTAPESKKKMDAQQIYDPAVCVCLCVFVMK